MRKVRLADVARHAGVSQGTASNVFNRPEQVRPTLREKVRAAAIELGYHGPDPAARLLRRGQVGAIGVVVGDSLTYVFNDPAMSLTMTGIARACDVYGTSLVLISAESAGAAARNISQALVDGFIVHCLTDNSMLVPLAYSRGLPVVAVDHPPRQPVSSVSIADQDAATQAARAVLERGHRRLAILSLEAQDDRFSGLMGQERRMAIEFAVTQERLGGYAQALNAFGITLDSVPIFEAANRHTTGIAAVEALFAAPPYPSALLCMSDVMALGAIEALRGRGIKVPDEVSVVGFDDIPEAERAPIPLTTVRQPLIEKGERAVNLLFDQPLHPAHIRLPATVVMRNSLDLAPHTA